MLSNLSQTISNIRPFVSMKIHFFLSQGTVTSNLLLQENSNIKLFVSRKGKHQAYPAKETVTSSFLFQENSNIKSFLPRNPNIKPLISKENITLTLLSAFRLKEPIWRLDLFFAHNHHYCQRPSVHQRAPNDSIRREGDAFNKAPFISIYQ